MLKISGKFKLDNIIKQHKKVQVIESYQLDVGHFDELHNKRGQANVASVSYWTEYGSRKHKRPPRPFMSQTHSQMQGSLAVKSAEFLDNHLTKGIAVTKAIDVLGQAYVEKVQQTILDGEFEALSESTIKQKGHDTLLIDTEQLYDSTKYKFRKTSI